MNLFFFFIKLCSNVDIIFLFVFLFFIIQTEKVTGQCAVLKSDGRFVYYLVHMLIKIH